MNDKNTFTFFTLSKDSIYSKKAHFTGSNSRITPPRVYFLVEREDGTKIVIVFLNILVNPFLAAEQTGIQFLCAAKVGKGRYKKKVDSPYETVIKVTVYYSAPVSFDVVAKPFDEFIKRLSLNGKGQ